MDILWQYQFRIILLGDSTVGKSSLLKRFTDGIYSDVADPTVGVDFYARSLDIEPGVKIKLQLWDTAGQERFRYETENKNNHNVASIQMTPNWIVILHRDLSLNNGEALVCCRVCAAIKKKKKFKNETFEWNEGLFILYYVVMQWVDSGGKGQGKITQASIFVLAYIKKLFIGVASLDSFMDDGQPPHI